VIVPHEDWDLWFSPGELAAESFLRITTPYPGDEMSALVVSPLVM
jgi:putative SOS response-associated peptidase YedK